jgi:HSP20 family protein
MAENTVVRSPNAASRTENTRNGKFFAPRVDIFETPTELLLVADLPGVKPDGIDLRYERGELVLRGKVAPERPQDMPVLEEYETGDFYRVFQIHETIDASKIEAEHKNGVLTVHLPKQESVKPKQVQVRAG